MKIAVFGKMASGKTYISKSLALRYNLEIYFWQFAWHLNSSIGQTNIIFSTSIK